VSDLDPYDLERFIEAQAGGVYAQALSELRTGRKTSHWIWFIFPQVLGLGRSAIAEIYAIRSAAEGQAYATHPVLGPRLHEMTEVVADSPVPAAQMFGEVDAMKLRSSMTLFEVVSGNQELFTQVLDAKFDGERCQQTLDFLRV